MLQLTVKNTREKIALRDIPALRTALLFGSLLNLAGLALGVWVSSWYLLLSLAVSFGLFLSGAAGLCPMSLILERVWFGKSAADEAPEAAPRAEGR